MSSEKPGRRRGEITALRDWHMYLTQGHRVSGTGTSIYSLLFTVSTFRKNISDLGKSGTETEHGFTHSHRGQWDQRGNEHGSSNLSFNLGLIPYTRVEVPVQKKVGNKTSQKTQW